MLIANRQFIPSTTGNKKFDVYFLKMTENTKYYVPILSNTLKSWIAVSLLNLNNALIS